MASKESENGATKNNKERIVASKGSENVYENSHPPENVNNVHSYELLPKKESQRKDPVCWVIVVVIVLIVVSVGIGITVHFVTRKPSKDQRPGKLRGSRGQGN